MAVSNSPCRARRSFLRSGVGVSPVSRKSSDNVLATSSRSPDCKAVMHVFTVSIVFIKFLLQSVALLITVYTLQEEREYSSDVCLKNKTVCRGSMQHVCIAYSANVG